MAEPNRIKEWRTRRNLTQQALGELIGTSMQQAQRLETGQRKLTQDWLTKLSRALSVTPADLLPALDQPERQTPLTPLEPVGSRIENAEERAVIRNWRLLEGEEKTAIALLLDRLAAAAERARVA